MSTMITKVRMGVGRQAHHAARRPGVQRLRVRG